MPTPATEPSTEPTPTDAPRAARRPQRREHHGDVFEDPYEWLRDKRNPEVIAHLEAENAWTTAQTAHLEPSTEEIFGEIKARTQETDLSVPVFRTHEGDTAWWYYSRTVEGQDYAISCRAPATVGQSPPDLDGAIAGEVVLLDGNAEAEGHEFFAVGSSEVSPDGRLLAYAVDVAGDERFTVRFKDLSTGELLPDVIPDTAYGLAWAGNAHLFYTRADDSWRPYVVLRHHLGGEVGGEVAGDAGTDPEVLTEPDERFWLGVSSSRDRRWLVFGAGSRLTSEYRLLATDDPGGEPRLVAPRRQGVEYDVEPAGDRLLIVHNGGGADFELAEAPLAATSHEDWRTILPHTPGVRILGVDAFAGHAVVTLRRGGLTGVHVLPRTVAGFGAGADVDFDEPLYTAYSLGSPEYDTPTIRLSFTSMLTPGTVYDYDLASGVRTLLKQTPVLEHPIRGAFDPGHYVQERTWSTAADGTQVPMSIVRRADTPLDGSAPALLYGYGSYEIPIDPGFSISRLSLLDRGLVYAIAHVRGGGELGRSWYEQGRTTSKVTTFTDFVACADHLVSAGYTSHDRLAAAGGSAGGLLMGAVANLAPEKFRAVHAGVPFVDALTTILDPSLPLTVIEWEEWGDPLHDPEVYAYMKSYSPYENLRNEVYPAILATTSLNDTRVYFVEPAKWVAALRETALNHTVPNRAGPDRAGPDRAGRPILLKTEMVAGHGGVSGRYKAWRETAFEYAWLVDQVTSAR